MVMMFGALLIAGSMPVFFESFDIRLMVVGYVVLRLAYIFLWYRAGKENPEYHKTAQRYVWGQTALQVLWILFAFLVPFGSLIFFVGIGIGVILELIIPYYANQAKAMPFHRHHIIERFGLLNIIVLGEILLSAALAIQAMSKSGHWTADLIIIAVCSTIVPFVLWWLYFYEEENLSSDEKNHVFLWGYGHFIIFAAAAAIGAGFAALIDASGDHGHGNPDSARWVISTSIALYLFGLWFIRDRHILQAKSSNLLLLFATLILLTPLLSVITLPLLTAINKFGIAIAAITASNKRTLNFISCVCIHINNNTAVLNAKREKSNDDFACVLCPCNICTGDVLIRRIKCGAEKPNTIIQAVNMPTQTGHQLALGKDCPINSCK